MPIKSNADESERETLQRLVNTFSKAQMGRLEEKIAEEWYGWDEREDMKPDLLQRIIENLFEGDWVDVANLAMFAWNLKLKPKQCL